MRDIKMQHNWAGDDYWPQLGMVTVTGNNLADSLSAGISQADGEKTVQSWSRIAILKTSSDIPVYWGFMAGANHAQFLNQPHETLDGKFGVRVGNGDVTFFVLAADMTSRPPLELVEVTDINDSRYAELPLY